ncbi:MAG: choline monooxygenase [Acidimicrobiaceae bacterium]|jgi:choline monooxygenase
MTTLPGSWYGDPAVHELERGRIFGREWLFFGFAERLQQPGEYVAAEVAGWNIVVVADDDGTLRGHHNVCRHRAGPLVGPGSGRVPSLVCRYHGWAYGLDGGLRSARDFGEGLDCDAISLEPVRVDTWRGLVFVNLDLERDARPLLDDLGTFVDACAPFAMERFVPVAEREHELECNWKTYADNYLEGYHIPLVHPGLNKEIDVKRYRVEVDDPHRWVIHSAPTRDGAVNQGRWLWRWPNLALNIYGDGMCVERYDPVSRGQTRLRYTYAFADPSAPANDEVVRMSTEVTNEDKAICEAVQRNLDSGIYAEGWLSPRHEAGLAAFQRWVRDAVN